MDGGRERKRTRQILRMPRTELKKKLGTVTRRQHSQELAVDGRETVKQ